MRCAMPRAALLAVAALALLLPAQSVALQKSFRSSIDSLLQLDPLPHKAAAASRLLVKAGTGRKAGRTPPTIKPIDLPRHALSNKVALQLGADHPELEPIVALLDSIIAELDAQDTQDTALLTNRTSDHTDAVAATTLVNETLASKQEAFHTADALCTSKRASLESDRADHDKIVLQTNSELSYIQQMKTAYTQLNGVGSFDFLQTVNNLADKITSVSAVDKAPLKSANLIGTHYGQDSDNLEAAIANLETKIKAKKEAAQASIAAVIKGKDDACAIADAKQNDVVLWTTKQTEAMVAEQAKLEDLAEATAMVTASKEETAALRVAVAEIKTKIEELAGLPASSALQTMPKSMLQMHMTKFEDIVEVIKTKLNELHARIDTEAAAEESAKTAKKAAWDAAAASHSAFSEAAAVQSASLTTAATRLAEALGEKNTAKAALDDETESQLRESAMFTQLRALLAGLESPGTQTNELATQHSQAMLALAMGAQRSHEDTIKRFNDLLTALEAEMVQKKSELQAIHDEKVATHSAREATHTSQLAAHEEANTAKIEAQSAMEAKMLEYETAVETLNSNNVLRGQEKELITKLLALVDALNPAPA